MGIRHGSGAGKQLGLEIIEDFCSRAEAAVHGEIEGSGHEELSGDEWLGLKLCHSSPRLLAFSIGTDRGFHS